VDGVEEVTNFAAADIEETPDFGGRIAMDYILGAPLDRLGAALQLTSQGFAQHQQAKGGMGYMSAHDPRIHFGLGHRKSIESLEITWPSGAVDKLSNVPINQIITVKEGAGIIPGKFPRIAWK